MECTIVFQINAAVVRCCAYARLVRCTSFQARGWRSTVGICIPRVLSSCLEYSSFGVRQGIARGGRSGSDGLFGDLIPYLESDGQFGAVVGGSHPVPGWAEVRRDPAEHCEESLC